MSNIYWSPVSSHHSLPASQPTPRLRLDSGLEGFKQLYQIRSLLRRERERERSYIWLFSGFWLGRSGDTEPHSAHPAQGPEHGWHLQLRQIPPGRGRPLRRTLRLGQGVLSPSSLPPTPLSINIILCEESFSNKINIFRHFELQLQLAGRNIIQQYNNNKCLRDGSCLASW